jgi:hypothetical protein
MIRRWKPWEKSTGPRTPEGKARSSINRRQGGHREALRELSREFRRLIEEQSEALDDVRAELADRS